MIYVLILFVAAYVLMLTFSKYRPYIALGAVISAMILYYLFRKEKAPILKEATRTRVTSYVPTPLYFGLLSGATLGGNCTPIGASANIAGIGILRKAGYEVKNTDFFKIGIPFTMAAVFPACIYIWLVYGIC